MRTEEEVRKLIPELEARAGRNNPHAAGQLDLIRWLLGDPSYPIPLASVDPYRPSFYVSS